MGQLSDYLGLPFEAICRQWVGGASAAGALSVRLAEVGTWWAPGHHIDFEPPRRRDAESFMKTSRRLCASAVKKASQRHAGALAQEQRLRPDALHLLFSRSGFSASVRAWAATGHARLLTAADLLAPLAPGRRL